jgi:quercetin dioxygenase-like cupin family protein
MIDFSKIPEVTIPHLKGGEGYAKARMADDGKVRIMQAILDPGCSIGLHKHEDSSEIVYILEGSGTAYLDGVKETLHAGMVHYCPKGSSHTMINDSKEPLKVLCVVPKQ